MTFGVLIFVPPVGVSLRVPARSSVGRLLSTSKEGTILFKAPKHLLSISSNAVFSISHRTLRFSPFEPRPWFVQSMRNVPLGN
jgi:hypothetical protein